MHARDVRLNCSRCARGLQVRSLPLFSVRNHPNTLAAADADGQHLWVVLHNLGDVSGGGAHLAVLLLLLLLLWCA